MNPFLGQEFQELPVFLLNGSADRNQFQTVNSAQIAGAADLPGRVFHSLLLIRVLSLEIPVGGPGKKELSDTVGLSLHVLAQKG